MNDQNDNLYIEPADRFGSYNVFEWGRLNEFGERYCHLPLVTKQEADDYVRNYNPTTANQESKESN